MRFHLLGLLALTVLSPALHAETADKMGPTYGIANASFPAPGVMAAGQPTGEQLQLLAEDSYHTVIDLRPPEEPHGFDEPAAAKENGLAYVNIPVTPATLDQVTIDRFLDAMRGARKPVIVHCSTASRVGALFYAWLTLEKKETPEKALAKARAIGLRSPELTGKVQKLVAERGTPAK
jgi:protein tyrosine phosphatase (PTP) superfamily phosphohydrolase (DUF442 family)